MEEGGVVGLDSSYQASLPVEWTTPAAVRGAVCLQGDGPRHVHRPTGDSKPGGESRLGTSPGGRVPLTPPDLHTGGPLRRLLRSHLNTIRH